MSLQSYYEDAYLSEEISFFNPDKKDLVITEGKVLFNYALESKNKFLPDQEISSLKVLEVGSGRGGTSLHFARLGASVTLVDFSHHALNQARELYRSQGLEVTTIQSDLTLPVTQLEKKYDLIIDSHLLHCIPLDPERISFYKFIYDHLSDEGIFISETMVHRKKIFLPEGFMMDQQNILWQLLGKWTPVRRVLDSLDLENELNSSGFKIIYFYYYGQLGVVPHKSFLDLPSEILPAVVRFVVKK
jgi:2-polyprenyl-3-methyl-5-hydroxy-6-metoxy-1,4-benzoquinol methylase